MHTFITSIIVLSYLSIKRTQFYEVNHTYLEIMRPNTLPEHFIEWEIWNLWDIDGLYVQHILIYLYTRSYNQLL